MGCLRYFIRMFYFFWVCVFVFTNFFFFLVLRPFYSFCAPDSKFTFFLKKKKEVRIFNHFECFSIFQTKRERLLLLTDLCSTKLSFFLPHPPSHFHVKSTNKKALQRRSLFPHLFYHPNCPCTPQRICMLAFLLYILYITTMQAHAACNVIINGPTIGTQPLVCANVCYIPTTSLSPSIRPKSHTNT